MKIWMKSMSALIMMAVLSFTMTACGADYGSPEGAVTLFMDAQVAGDTEAIRESLTRDDIEMLSAKNDAVDVKLKDGGVTEYTIQGVKMEKTKDGDEAAVVTVNTTVEGKKQPMDIWCIKEGEEWKVSLTTTAFANMKDGDVKTTAS